MGDQPDVQTNMAVGPYSFTLSTSLLSDVGGALSRSVFSGLMTVTKSGTSMTREDLDELDSMLDIGSGARLKTMHPDQMEDAVDENKEVTVHLHESDTFFFLNVPGRNVQSATDEGADVASKVEAYNTLCKTRLGNELYVERGINTFGAPQVDKQVQTESLKTTNRVSHVTPSDIYFSCGLSDAENTIETTSSESSMGAVDDSAPKEDLLTKNDIKHITQLEAFKKAVFFTERAVGLNSYQPLQAQYRDLVKYEDPYANLYTSNKSITPLPPAESVFLGFDVDPVESPESPTPSTDNLPDANSKSEELSVSGPHVQPLWAFQCPLTKGRNVSCLCWNRTNQDLLAVGYGQVDFGKQKSGLVCCWSLKNLEYPERVYSVHIDVTALDFSITRPNLLAVGLYDGIIAVYNVCSNNTAPQVDTSRVNGRHIGPVWQLQWIVDKTDSQEDDASHDEKLTSVSSDGIVAQWVIRKGLECNIIHQLKRPSGKLASAALTKAEDTPVSHYAVGMCLDFSPVDDNLYLVGTEDGHIHLCLCTYTEQYSSTYTMRTGPVYTVQWSRFSPDIFLGCGADWLIHIWHQSESQPALALQSSENPYCDACWSTHRSMVIAAVKEESLEVWDLSQNVVDPVIIWPAQGDVKFHCVTFAANSNCILAGDSNGAVTACLLNDLEKPPDDTAQDEELEHKVLSALASKFND